MYIYIYISLSLPIVSYISQFVLSQICAEAQAPENYATEEAEEEAHDGTRRFLDVGTVIRIIGNHRKTMGKPWEKPWENHRNMVVSWDSMGHIPCGND